MRLVQNVEQGYARSLKIGVLKDLQKKLEELEAWTELQELVKEYRTKIEEYL